MSKTRAKRPPSVSETLRAAIVDSGVSLQQLARDTEVDVSALSRFVRDERSLKLESVDRLAARLGLVLKLERRRN